MRRRWVQIDGKLVEVSQDYVHPDTPTAVLGILGDKNYHGLHDTKGVDISTRTKHREYMKQNNLALVGDYTNEWASAQKKRTANKDTSRALDVARAYEKHTRR